MVKEEEGGRRVGGGGGKGGGGVGGGGRTCKKNGLCLNSIMLKVPSLFVFVEVSHI